MMITQEKLAQQLGITRTTVARALNGSKNIKSETKEKILKLAEQLGYEKNYLGSSLAKNKKKKITAIIVNSINEDYSKQLKKGLKDFQEETKAYGIKIKILEVNINDSKKQLELLKETIDSKIDGLIIIPLDRQNILNILKPVKDKIKIVSIGKPLFNDSVFIDSKYEKSGRIVAEIFINIVSKNKKILLIDAGDDLLSSGEYLKGFYKKIIESNRKIVGPVKIENFMQNKKRIFSYLSDEIGGIYINRYAYETIEYLSKSNEFQTKFVINGLNDKIIKLLKDKKIVATVSEDIYNQGYIAGKKIFELLYKTGLKSSQDYSTKINIIFNECLE